MNVPNEFSNKSFNFLQWILYPSRIDRINKSWHAWDSINQEKKILEKRILFIDAKTLKRIKILYLENDYYLLKFNAILYLFNAVFPFLVIKKENMYDMIKISM